MELSLKKARKLETKIGAFVAEASNNFDTQVLARISSNADEVEKLAIEARTKFFASIKNVDDLNKIRYDIRKLISDANAAGGENSIDNLLSDKVQLESNLHRINSLFGFNKFDKELLVDELAANKKQQELGSRYATSVSFSVDFLTHNDEQKFKDDKVLATKKIEEIEDKLAEANFSKRISLGANSVKLLQDNGLL